MAANIQILLALAYIVFGGAHVLDPNKSNSDSPNARVPYHPKKHPGNRAEGNRFNEAGPIRRPEDQRPINGDMFSYNTQHAYNDYYQNGYPEVDPYFAYPFGMPNFNNIPGLSYGLPNMHNNYNRPGQYRPNKYTNAMHSHGGSNEKSESGDDGVVIEHDNKNESPVEEEKHVAENPKTNENENGDSPKKEKDKDGKPVDLNAKKDYLLVDNNGHSYLLHENQASQPGANNVVYVPIPQNNPQQQTNQVYQVVNGNPAVTANKLNGNVMTYPGQSNFVSNNNNPAYIMVYANGQLIQIPGIVVNPAQNHIAVPNGNQGSNVYYNVPNNNVQNIPVVQYPSNLMYANVPNQGNNPMTYQVPNTVAVPNNVPNTGVVMNTQPNPNVNNNNAGAYATGTQPNYGNQIYQPVNPNPAGTVNNAVVQPAVAFPGVNNANVYQPPIPAREKEPNIVLSPNNTPVVSAPAGNLQPVTQPPAATNDINTVIHPAIMVSGFKENDKEKKDDKNEIKNDKEEIKEEIIKKD